MATQTTSTTFPVTMGLEALSPVEMNTQILVEMHKSLEATNALVANLQQILAASLQENKSLKERIIQLETANLEEAQNNAQTIAALSETVDRLTGQLSSMMIRMGQQEGNFGTLVDCYNKHNHEGAHWIGVAEYHDSKGPPSHPYQPEPSSQCQQQ